MFQDSDTSYISISDKKEVFFLILAKKHSSLVIKVLFFFTYFCNVTQ